MRRYLVMGVLVMILVVVMVPVVTVWLVQWLRPPVEVERAGPTLKVLLHQRGTTVTMPLEEYLVGVVAAEMPAEFHEEALKAQAVAARTYALKKLQLGLQGTPNPHHPGADVCTDPTHCQAWQSREEMEKRWGIFRYFLYREKMERAVRETTGQVLTYKGQLIDPVYHSNAGGRTENSEEVWQFAVPYLRSVPSPWDQDSPRYQAVHTFPLADLDRLLGTSLAAMPVAQLTGGNPPAWKVLKASSTGRVRTAQVGGKTFAGTELRRILGLNSTRLSVQVYPDRLVFVATGYGHGVGMSQYGANGMAREGKTYLDILTHYYTGVKVETVN